MALSIYPPAYDTPVGALRNLCGDTEQYVDPAHPTDPAEYLFGDDRLNAFLTLNDGNVHLAAADAIDVIADNEILVSKKIRTEDLQTDGAAVGNALRMRSAALRAQARLKDKDADDDGGMEIVDFQYIPDQLPWGLRSWL